MNEILARVYAKQQAEINKKLQQEAEFRAKREREIRAFVASPVWQTLMACKDMRLKSNAGTLKDLMIYERDKVFAGQTNNVYFSTNAAGGKRWQCEESRDTNTMVYQAPFVAAYGPNTSFIASFIDFLAEMLHPDDIAQVVANSAQNNEQEHNRRRIQPV